MPFCNAFQEVSFHAICIFLSLRRLGGALYTRLICVAHVLWCKIYRCLVASLIQVTLYYFPLEEATIRPLSPLTLHVYVDSIL
jgi:hypothetical protein